MTLNVTHTFVSAVPDDPVAAAAGEVLTQSHWNATHTITGTVGPSIGARTILTANTNFYVATTGNDSNSGTLASPWGTLQHAMSFISENLDLASFYVTVNIGAGIFAGVDILNTVGGGIVQFNGAGRTSTTLNRSPINAGCFNHETNSSAVIGLDNVTLNDNGLTLNAMINLGGAGINVVFGLASAVIYGIGTVHLDVGITTTVKNFGINCSNTGGIVTAQTGASNTGFTLSGTFSTVIGLDNFGQFQDIANWVLSGGPTFDTFLVVTDQGLFFEFLTGNYSGAGTGQRFALSDGGVVSTGGAPSGTLGPNQFPGTINGVVDSTAFYDGFFGPLPGINMQTGASYTLAVTDELQIVEMNNAGANTLTVPTNASVPFMIGSKIRVVQTGAGATTIAAAGGVTVHNAGALGGQWKEALLYKRDTDEWVQTT